MPSLVLVPVPWGSQLIRFYVSADEKPGCSFGVWRKSVIAGGRAVLLLFDGPDVIMAETENTPVPHHHFKPAYL